LSIPGSGAGFRCLFVKNYEDKSSMTTDNSLYFADVNISDIRSEKDIPSDVKTLQPLVWSLFLEIKELRAQNTLLRKEVFGPKSEKIVDKNSEQTQLEDLFNQLPAVNKKPEETFIVVKQHSRRRNHPGRNAIPEDIPVRREVFDIPEEEKRCACCGRDKAKIGEVTRDIIERVPARYEHIIEVRPKYACPRCKDGVAVAEPSMRTPIARGLAGLSLLLFVIMSKYRYHLPLYRIQRQIYHESRIWFTRSTMVGWIRELCVPLERIYRAMIDELKKGRYIHADESFLRRVGSEAKSKSSYMWVYRGTANVPVVIFDYRENRTADGPRLFLTGCSPGTYLMIDGYEGYNEAIRKYGLIAMLCMVHLRRQFIEARDVGDHVEYANKILKIIGRLYRAEGLGTRWNFIDEQRHALRQRISTKIMATLRENLINPGFMVLPQSRIGKAIGYALRHWDQATHFLDAGDLPIDNNPVEQVIRRLAVGRDNWLFVVSEAGGRRMAIIYSIIATCEILRIDPEEYLKDVLLCAAIRAPGQSVKDLTPIEWAKSRNDNKLPKVTPMYPSLG
jgi:transposase